MGRMHVRNLPAALRQPACKCPTLQVGWLITDKPRHPAFKLTLWGSSQSSIEPCPSQQQLSYYSTKAVLELSRQPHQETHQYASYGHKDLPFGRQRL